MKNILIAAACACVLLVAGCDGDDGSQGPAGPAGPAGAAGADGADGAGAVNTLDLTILHLNDTHAHLNADDFDLDVSDLGLSTTLSDGSAIQEVEVIYGGYPANTTLMRQISNSTANVLKLHAGDVLTGTIYYPLFRGEDLIFPETQLMNRICFDALVLGNHEFDDGDAGAADLINDLNSTSCETAVVSANISLAANSPLHGGYFTPYAIKEISGTKVGIIGLTDAAKTNISSSPDAGTVITDELAAAQEAVSELVGQGIDHIILLTHIGYNTDVSIASALPEIDVIVGGDSATLLGDSTFSDLGFNPAGDYPTLATNADGDTVCIVQAWDHSKVVGRLNVSFEDGSVSSCDGAANMGVSNVFQYEGFDGSDRTLSGDDQQLVLSSLTSEDEITYVVEDTYALSIIADADAQTDPLLDQVIGTAAENLCYERIPGQGRSAIAGCQEITYQQGSDITMIVAKSFLAAAGDADIAIQNGGGVREDLPAGDITIRSAYTLLPFSNTIVQGGLTGSQIALVLEQALRSHLENDGSTGSYPYGSGIRFDVDSSQTFGNRVSNIEVNSRVEGDWVPLNETTVYSVVTNNYIAAGRDGYEVFADIDWVDTTQVYTFPLIQYVEAATANGEAITKLPLSEYSTKSYIDSAGCDHSTTTGCPVPEA